MSADNNNTNIHAADGTAGGDAAQNIGDKVKGGWNAFPLVFPTLFNTSSLAFLILSSVKIYANVSGSDQAPVKVSEGGNINSFVDNVGEQIAGRGDSTTGTAPASRTEGGERPSAVAAKGADEIQQGMNQIKR
ncbi:hypothetical protein IAR55_002594 [Kwoniella newhampshirensis]|uniref:Uncharacterized protein n=1 Tax=Kwoniella newhampshirensis TaxID=1651941 RepID=A0AAW0Z1W6_9TREE